MIKRAITIAIVVGTLLNLINQPSALLGEESVDWLKLVLTYCVPFIVSLVSSYLTVKDINTGK